MSALADVFTAEEIARAAGVPSDAIQSVVVSGAVKTLPGTAFFEAGEAVRAGIEARHVVRQRTTLTREAPAMFGTGAGTPFVARRRDLPTLASTLAHGTFVVSILWLTAGAPETATVEQTEPRLVFLATPGSWGRGRRRRPAESSAAARGANTLRLPQASIGGGCLTEQDPDPRSTG